MSNIHTINNINQNNPRNPNGGPQMPNSLSSIWPPISKIYFRNAKFLLFNTIIIILQVLMFVVSMIVAKLVYGKTFHVSSIGKVSVNLDALVLLGAKYAPLIKKGEVYRFVTSAFLHSNFSHILFNVAFQLILAFDFERDWGHWRIALTFFLCQIGATALSCVATPEGYSVGSSGAISGYIGVAIAYLVFNWSSLNDRFMRLILYIFMVVANVFFGLMSEYTDNYAHLGGFLTGILLGPVIEKNFVHFGEKRLIIRIVSGVLCLAFVGGLVVGTFFVK